MSTVSTDASKGGGGGYPPFSLSGDRYDQSTFWGRLQRIIDLFNPRLLFVSDDDIVNAQVLLKEYKEGTHPADTSDATLWDARALIEARIHPDTGEQVPTLLCFAAYAPMQPPIIVGMLWPGASIPMQYFWQWYNQSYNVAVNYANRNAAGTLSTTQLGVAYTAAVGAACGSTYGFSKISDRLVKKYPAASGSLRLLIPFISVVAAGTISLLVVRQSELTNGVSVSDETGKVHGSSQTAAQSGLAQCALARVLWNIPVLAIPPVLMQKLEKTAAFRANPRLKLPALTVISSLAVVAGLYPAQAIFAQRATIAAKKLEPQFQSLRYPNGKPITEFYYNKGL